ncbi:MAG: PAS-domain containing protein [Proteobacteria bacterium]|nr:PAS-domain containing protein [Pseudomonadota bacterium]
MAAMIQILCQFHYIDALKASSTGRYDAPPLAGAGGGKTALAWLSRATHLVFALCALMTLAAVLTTNLAVAQIQPGETANVPRRKVVAAVPRSWPPQYSLDENGKPIGFAIDVMDEIAARAGLSVEYVVAENISAAGDMLNRGLVDLVPNSGIVPERMEGGAHTAPVETFVVSLFVRKDTHDIKGVPDLIGRKLAVVQRNIGFFLFGKRQDIKINVYRDVRTALFELIAGHVDALVYPQSVLSTLARQIRVGDRIKVVGEPLKEIKRAIRVRKGNIELLAILNEAVEGFVGSPAYQRIYVKWYGEPMPFWTVARIIWAMGGLVVLVLIAMALWRYRSIVKLNRELRETIAGRKKAEQAVAEKSALLNATFESMSQGIIVTDPALNVLAFNHQYADLLGFPGAFLRTGMAFEEVLRFQAERGDFGPGEVEEIVSERLLARKRGEILRRERPLPDGRIAIVNRSPLPDGSYVTTFTDITERKKAEQEIATKSALLETTLESMSQGIVAYDGDLKLVAFNQNYVDFWSYPPGFIRLGMSYEDIIRAKAKRGIFGPVADIEELVRERVAARRNSKKVRHERTLADGRVIAVHRDPMPDGGYVTTFTDITERQRTEEELVESRRRFAGILEIADDAIISMDEEQNIEIFNKGAEKIFGYGAEEVLGKPLDILLPSGFAQAHKRHVENFRDSSDTARIMGELREVFGLRKDGAVFPAEISISHLELEGKHIFTAFLRDVTKWKRAEEELRIAMEEAMAANRTKSEFLANMSHELRTPLNAIIGFSEVMQKGTLGPVGNPKFLEYADDINDSGRHLLSLINDILDLSKIEIGKIELREETIDVASVLRSCLILVKERADDKDLKLTCEIPDDLPLLRADGRKLKQIVINLLSNAVKFTDPGGEVTLKAWFRPLSGFVLQVTDNGIGIALEDIPKVLEPFSQVDSTLSRKYDGTGLGLPLTKSLVEIHGGSFDLQSKLGVGTTVTARFPAERIVYTVTKAADTTSTASSGLGG